NAGGRRLADGVLGAPAAVVAWFFTARKLRCTQRIELVGRHVAAVGETALQHVRQDLAIAVHPLHLVDRGSVVVEPQPRHRIQDRLHRLQGRASDVGVLDAQQEDAAVLARERPWEQRRADVAEMDEAGGTGREAGANGGHGRRRRSKNRDSTSAYPRTESSTTARGRRRSGW